MPAPIGHFILGSRAAAHPAVSETIDMCRPTLFGAFFLGAIAPDAGYFPGGERFPTDLAHYVRPAGLGRALLSLAETAQERAFALGWLTHVIGDVQVHPLINFAVCELLTGSRARPIAYAADTANHIRVEMGLDAWLLSEFDGPGAVSPQLRGHSTWSGPLRRNAYRATYDFELSDSQIARSDRALARWLMASLRWTRFQSWRLGRESPTVPVRLLDTAFVAPIGKTLGVLARDSVPHAMLSAVRPSPWLAREVKKVINVFGDVFSRHYLEGFVGLEDCNLDTGEPTSDPSSYPPARQTMSQLQAHYAE